MHNSTEQALSPSPTAKKTGFPKISLYDSGGEVHVAGGNALQDSPFFKTLFGNKLTPAPATPPASQPTVTTTTPGSVGTWVPPQQHVYGQPQQPAAPVAPPPAPPNVYNTRPGTPRRETNPLVPSGAPQGNEQPQYGYSPIPLFDEGGDVNVNDGKHQLAIVQDGERVLTPEENEQYKKEHPEEKSAAPAPLIPMRGDTSTSDQLIPTGQPAKGTPQERAAIKVDKQKAMGSGDLVALGKAAIAERHLEPSTSDVAGQITERPTAGLPKIGLPQEAHQETAGGPLIPGAGTSETPSEQRDLRNMERKAKVADLEKQRQDALASGDLTTADKLAVAKAELQKTPWSDRSILGKIGHVASVAGNIAGDIVSPNVVALIPGTDLNRALKERSAYGRILPDAEADEKTAQAAKTEAELKAGPTEKPAEYEIKTDDQGRMWRVDKLSKQQPQLITFDQQGQPTLSAAPAGVQPPAFEQPTFGKKTEKGMDVPANETQQSEFSAQMSAIAPDLSSAERSTFAFPSGYKPTLREIEDNKKLLRQANATKLAGKREELANQTAQAALNKRTQEEKMVEQIAKDIAPMDVSSLSQLKTITSMRSDQRSLIYARAKELNPEFNTAEVDRRVKMLDNFTNGKDGQSLQSFGTFLEHAGDANRVVQNIRNGVTPQILNVPLNALEKHGWGTTATQLAAALEPVRKEFEGFLLGGRALYAEDRKAAEAILSDSSTPAQVQAALKQMAHTVSARYREMNNRFKNTMKVGIEEGVGPLSSEAFNGAEEIGVTELGGKTLRDGKHGYGWYNTSTEEK